MKSVLIILTIINALGSHALADEREVIQQQLNQECEAARLEKLIPIREKYAAECVNEMERSQAHCDRFYSDYGNQGGGQTPLFYDLPECEKAWDYLNSQRRPD